MSEFIFEFRTLGNFTQIRVVDTASLKEAVLSAPSSLSRNEMIRLGTNKMKYILSKN